jgi:hypothetical protein
MQMFQNVVGYEDDRYGHGSTASIIADMQQMTTAIQELQQKINTMHIQFQDFEQTWRSVAEISSHTMGGNIPDHLAGLQSKACTHPRNEVLCNSSSYREESTSKETHTANDDIFSSEEDDEPKAKRRRVVQEEMEVSFPLHRAAREGHVEDIERIVCRENYNVNCLHNGRTALHYAAAACHLNVITKLIDLGCDVYKTDNKGYTALSAAAARGHVHVVTKLIELGCDMNKTDNNGY